MANKINPEIVDYLTYDAESKTFLKWTKASSYKIKPGMDAGSKSVRGGYEVRFRGRLYKAHRLVWFLFNGEPGHLQIDHIDRNQQNNAIENLRLASNLENTRNKSHRKNISGIRNVTYFKRDKKWRVALTINRKPKHIGYFDDLDLAELVAYEAREKFYGAFSGNDTWRL